MKTFFEIRYDAHSGFWLTECTYEPKFWEKIFIPSLCEALPTKRYLSFYDFESNKDLFLRVLGRPYYDIVNALDCGNVEKVDGVWRIVEPRITFAPDKDKSYVLTYQNNEGAIVCSLCIEDLYFNRALSGFFAVKDLKEQEIARKQKEELITQAFDNEVLQ